MRETVVKIKQESEAAIHGLCSLPFNTHPGITWGLAGVAAVEQCQYGTDGCNKKNT